MTGQISDGPRLHIDGDPDMTATLAEVREFYLPRPASPIGNDYDQAAQVCVAAAQQWLDAHGLESEIAPFADDDRVGVRFSVIIGRQDGSDRDPTTGTDEPTPWRWSARWTHWADKLAALRRFGGTPITGDTGDDNVIDFGAKLAMREHAAVGP